MESVRREDDDDPALQGISAAAASGLCENARIDLCAARQIERRIRFRRERHGAARHQQEVKQLEASMDLRGSVPPPDGLK